MICRARHQPLTFKVTSCCQVDSSLTSPKAFSCSACVLFGSSLRQPFKNVSPKLQRPIPDGTAKDSCQVDAWVLYWIFSWGEKGSQPSTQPAHVSKRQKVSRPLSSLGFAQHPVSDRIFCQGLRRQERFPGCCPSSCPHCLV